jgi:hypothetical protein
MTDDGSIMSGRTGKGFIKYVAALGGLALGWGVGAGIAGAWTVSSDSFLGRSAQSGAPVGGVLLQFGLGILCAIVVFRVVSRIVAK